jgi:hypothetical protein
MATNYQALAAQAAKRYGIDPNIFVRQIAAESGFNPSARSPAGALGIAQIMPATARGWGVNPLNPVASLDAAAKNMSRYVRSFGGSYEDALEAYNAGPGAVNRQGPPRYAETRNYVKKILGGMKMPQTGGMLPSSPPDVASTVASTGGAPQYNIQQLLPSLRAASIQAISGSLDKGALLRALSAAKIGGGNAVAQPLLSGPSPADTPTARGPAGFASAPDESWAQSLAKKFGLTVGSTYRSPSRNASVGGAKGSRHMTHGGAADISGSASQMAALARWAIKSGLFAEVFYDPVGSLDNGRFSKRGIGGHRDHVHLSFGGPALKYFYGRDFK